MQGIYIVFEGIVGSGKSTQSKILFNHLKEKYPERHIIWTREPGGSEIADQIRKIVQASKFNEKMSILCEAYLYAASRAQALETVVNPVLKNGGIVISDRSYLSSVAYQGKGNGLGIEKVIQINQPLLTLDPNLIIYIDIDAKTGLSRSHDPAGDKFEHNNEEFFNRVIEGYSIISKDNRYKLKWFTVNGKDSVEQVHTKIMHKLKTSLGL